MNTEYHIYFEDQLDVVDKIKTMNYPENYYFYAIQNDHLMRNSNLQQTKGWDNGTFDPLQ
jgi:hypothetical protein